MGIYFVLYFHTDFTYTMATGHDENEDALLGYPQETSTTNDNKAVLEALATLQGSMQSMASGINKMGEAWTTLAASKAGSNAVTDSNGHTKSS